MARFVDTSNAPTVLVGGKEGLQMVLKFDIFILPGREFASWSLSNFRRNNPGASNVVTYPVTYFDLRRYVYKTGGRS